MSFQKANLSTSQENSMTTDEFIQNYAERSFNYKEELLAGLESGEWEFSSYTGGPNNKVTAATLSGIYSRKKDQSGSQKTPAAQTLAAEFTELCTNLNKNPQDIVDVWSFRSEDTFITLFVSRTGDIIAGVVRTEPGQ